MESCTDLETEPEPYAVDPVMDFADDIQGIQQPDSCVEMSTIEKFEVQVSYSIILCCLVF